MDDRNPWHGLLYTDGIRISVIGVLAILALFLGAETMSVATNLGNPYDGFGVDPRVSNVYVHDLLHHGTFLISRETGRYSPGGNGDSTHVACSAGASFAAFQSDSTPSSPAWIGKRCPPATKTTGCSASCVPIGDALAVLIGEIASREPYARHFAGFDQPWNYASPEETAARLERAGFGGVRCWLQPWRVIPPDPAEFLAAVCLGPHLDRLPELLHGAFVADLLAAEGEPLTLDYVRLNIDARAA